MSEVKVLNQSNQEVALSFEHYFEPFRIQANEWMEKAKQIKITDASQTDLMKEARTARLALRGVRISVDKLHEEKKARILEEGQTLDKIKRDLTALIKPIEEELKAREDFVEIQEENRKKVLREERVSLLSPFIGHQQAELMQLGDMDEQVFQSVLIGQKTIKEQKEKQAIEDQRLKDEADKKRNLEDIRIREENDRLITSKQKIQDRIRKVTSLGMIWSDHDPSDVLGLKNKEWTPGYTIHLGKLGRLTWCNFEEATDEFFDQEFIKIKSLVDARNKEIATEKEARDKAALKVQEKLKKETDERKRLEKEAADKAAQEEADRKKRLADERKLKRGPDKARLLSFASQIESLQALEMTSEEGQEILKATKGLLDKTVVYLKSKAEAL